jgi:hypothetical protein
MLEILPLNTMSIKNNLRNSLTRKTSRTLNFID